MSLKKYIRCKLLGHTWWKKSDYKICLDCGELRWSKPHSEQVQDVKDLINDYKAGKLK